MEGYLVSLQNGTLKVSLAGTDEVAQKKVTSDLSNPEIFAEELGSLMLEKFGQKASKLPLNFIIGSKDLFLNFLTVSKGETDEDQLVELAKSKLGSEGVAIENLYFSYQKIAPFVYQLVGISKDNLEKYLKISTDLGFELGSVIPWVLLLPKHISKTGEPAIFVYSDDTNKFLILSELGGIYHLGLLDNTKSSEDLEELIQKLSVYQRNAPITNIYTVNTLDLHLGEKYKVTALDIGDVHKFVEEECTNTTLLTTQLNLITLLPLPAPAKSLSPVAYVGGVVGVLLLGGIFFGVKALNSNNEDQLAQTNDSLVLSEVDESSESTPAAEDVNVDEINTEELDLNKAYLRIRVENGTLIGGLAGSTRDALLEDGYDVIGVWDADESDRVTTLVRINSKNVIYKDLLSEDLAAVFESIEVIGDLEADLDYDVLIIAGSDDVATE